MQTLEERVDRLERSCRRWRIGFCAVAMAAAGVAVLGAAEANHPADAAFGHLTVQSLMVQSVAGGPLLLASGDKDRASITMVGPGSTSTILLSAQKDAANVSVSRTSDKGVTGAAMRADDQSGTINVRNVDGKSKEIEPE